MLLAVKIGGSMIEELGQSDHGGAGALALLGRRMPMVVSMVESAAQAQQRKVPRTS
jgi:hypothetical protein